MSAGTPTPSTRPLADHVRSRLDQARVLTEECLTLARDVVLAGRAAAGLDHRSMRAFLAGVADLDARTLAVFDCLHGPEGRVVPDDLRPHALLSSASRGSRSRGGPTYESAAAYALAYACDPVICLRSCFASGAPTGVPVDVPVSDVPALSEVIARAFEGFTLLTQGEADALRCDLKSEYRKACAEARQLRDADAATPSVVGPADRPSAATRLHDEAGVKTDPAPADQAYEEGGPVPSCDGTLVLEDETEGAEVSPPPCRRPPPESPEELTAYAGNVMRWLFVVHRLAWNTQLSYEGGPGELDPTSGLPLPLPVGPGHYHGFAQAVNQLLEVVDTDWKYPYPDPFCGPNLVYLAEMTGTKGVRGTSGHQAAFEMGRAFRVLAHMSAEFGRLPNFERGRPLPGLLAVAAGPRGVRDLRAGGLIYKPVERLVILARCLFATTQGLGPHEGASFALGMARDTLTHAEGLLAVEAARVRQAPEKDGPRKANRRRGEKPNRPPGRPAKEADAALDARVAAAWDQWAGEAEEDFARQLGTEVEKLRLSKARIRTARNRKKPRQEK